MTRVIDSFPSLSYVVIIIVADVLPTHEVRASAMILMYLTRNIGNGVASGMFTRLDV